MKSAIALTFHKIGPVSLRSVIESDSVIARYTVSNNVFKEIIDIVLSKKCCTVSEYVNKKNGDWLILTFDDGHLSDYEIAFPVLTDKGIKATFFINVENINLPGYLGVSQLKEMIQTGMEIGSHGLTHRYLITMNHMEAHKEIKDSKDRLEQKIGIKITSFAPVGGHYKRWMMDIARRAEYRAFATMIPGITNSEGDMTVLKRNHIQSHHNISYVSRVVGGDFRTLIINRLRYNLLQIPKTFLGINNYNLVKKYLLSLTKVSY